MKVIISDHAMKRARARLGLKKKAVLSQAQKAFYDGETVGGKRGDEVLKTIYNGMLYIFGLCKHSKAPILITVINKDVPYSGVQQEDSARKNREQMKKRIDSR